MPVPYICFYYSFFMHNFQIRHANVHIHFDGEYTKNFLLSDTSNKNLMKKVFTAANYKFL